MTLYLSQKSLLFLFCGGFLLGMASGALYCLTGSLLRRAPRAPWGKALFYLLLHLRDFLLFTLLGVADAILFFVFNSGRVRIAVFFLNFLGFLFCRFWIFRPIKRWIVRRFFSSRGS